VLLNPFAAVDSVVGALEARLSPLGGVGLLAPAGELAGDGPALALDRGAFGGPPARADAGPDRDQEQDGDDGEELDHP
jgi:hypothetical protein